MARIRVAALLTCGLFAFASCQNANVRKPEDPTARLALENVEGQLLSPFKNGQVIAAEHLSMIVSPNFYNQIIMPAGGKKLRDKKQAVTRWSVQDAVARDVFLAGQSGSSNQRPGIGYRRGSRYLRFRVGQTNFLVTGTADVHVLLDSPSPTMTAHATGKVIYSRGKGEKPEPLREIRFTDGRIQVRR